MIIHYSSHTHLSWAFGAFLQLWEIIWHKTLEWGELSGDSTISTYIGLSFMGLNHRYLSTLIRMTFYILFFLVLKIFFENIFALFLSLCKKKEFSLVPWHEKCYIANPVTCASHSAWHVDMLYQSHRYLT